MEINNSLAQVQREALRSFLLIQEWKKQTEAPLGLNRKRAEETVRQQAEASRRKVDEDRRHLNKLQAESTEIANGMMRSVNRRWYEVKSALRDAVLSRLLSDPSSFRTRSDGLGDPGQELNQCQTAATEAQEAVQRALIELREYNQRRFFSIFGAVITLLALVVILAAIKLG